MPEKQSYVIASPDLKITYDERRVQALRGAADVIGIDAPPAALIELAEWIVAGPAIVQTNRLISRAEAEQIRQDLAGVEL